MTLSFSWATNASYSTGPDVSTPTKVDPSSTANGFIAGTIAAPQHINFLFDAIGDQIIKAVDGVNGGTYTLTDPLHFAGDPVEFESLLDIQDQAQIANAAVLTVVPGGLIDVIAGGTIETNESGDLKIDDATDGWRLTLAPQSIQPDGSGFPSWTPRFSGDIHAGVTSGWQQDDVSAPFTIVFPINLPPGDDILTIDVSVNGSSTSGTGGHTNKPTGTDLPSAALVRVDAQGNATVIARRSDHASNVTSYNLDHVIQLLNGSLTAGTLPHTVTNDAYYIVVKGETGGDAVAGEYAVTGVSGTCISRAYRSALMVY